MGRFLACLLMPLSLTAEPLECRWAATPPTIDGTVDDVWKSAQAIDAFHLPWLGNADRPAKKATRAKLLWDHEYLYFLADMDDADLLAKVVEHDGQTWLDDVFELFLRPDAAKPGYYEFQVNAAGTMIDMFIPRLTKGAYEKYIAAQPFHMEAKVARRGTLNDSSDVDQGWTVEGRIPWSDFVRTGGRPQPNDTWTFALCRYDYSTKGEPELSTCAPLTNPQPNFHAIDRYAPLKFIPAPATDKPPPMTMSNVVGHPEPPLPYRVVRAFPDVPLDNPIFAISEPNSNRLLAITQESKYGNTELHRFTAESQGSERVMTFDGMAYACCFHPKFAENGYIYFHVKFKKSKTCEIRRYVMSRTAPFAIDATQFVIILKWNSDGHDGGGLDFGPDGFLYLTTGDTTSDSDHLEEGQKLDTLYAKTLRIDVDHPADGKLYGIPKDNPFVGRANVAPETYVYGLRNPWRLSIDQPTGAIWVGNNGQDIWEQLYRLKAGANYGWSVYEGSHPFYPNRKLGPDPLTPPTLEHHHSEARSITGGIVYRGRALPELVGAYIYGDYSTGRIWAAKYDGDKQLWKKELARTTLQITCFLADPAGELLITDSLGNGKGGLYRLEVAPPPAANARPFPRTLTESGLFTSVAKHELHPSVIPYTVNSPLWSDGAYKVRALGLPPGGKIGYTSNRGFDLPDGTVIVKSFALETIEGDASTRKWVETRFMTKQAGDWAGYSYRWNDAQTEATLVESAGADREMTLGDRKQTWHYPSRAECMVCHSRAANFSLGICEVQLNRPSETGENQLSRLERWGLLNVKERKELRGKHITALGKQARDVDRLLGINIGELVQRPYPEVGSLLPEPAAKRPSLVNPADPQADLTKRVMAYLHSNCASCHVEGGGGNAVIDLEWRTPLAKTKLIDVKPMHHTFDLPDARLIASGHPERSVLFHRISTREKGQMPPLSSNRVDPLAVALLREWIVSLKPEAEKPRAPE